LKGRNNFEDLGMDERILKWILKNRKQGSGRWPATGSVKTVMTFWVPHKKWEFD